MTDWTAIDRHIGAVTGHAFHNRTAKPIGGGCINQAYHLSDGRRDYFVKLNRADRLAMFEAEADGLQAIVASQGIRAPAPLCWGTEGDRAYLVLEYLPLHGAGSGQRLGQELAQMHRHCGPHFGWSRDNTIGLTPQPNTPSDDWVEFWRSQRLGHQLRLAAGRGGHLRGGEALLEALPAFFTDYRPLPSLLHGDLWSGNAAYDHDGRPVIFDPAVYYGDREADLAMTELFGGFPAAFYAAYDEAWPRDPGYAVRKTLYNLYHVLNHFNLFGGGYLSQAQDMIQRLLSEVR